MATPDPPPFPVLVALASLAVHARELLGESASPTFDRAAIEGCLAAPGVEDYLARLDDAGLLPEVRP